MPKLYLTPASISYLTQFLLALTITIYLIGRSLRYRRQLSRQDGYLLVFFISFTALILLFFLEYSLLPSERLIPFNLENTAVAVLLAALIQFAYHFPFSNDKQKIERWVVFAITCVYILVELKEAVKIFSILRQEGHVAVRPDYLQNVMIAEFAWVVFVFARKAIRHWKLPVVRNFTLIMLIPLAVALSTNYSGINIPYPVFSSIGILFTIFLFALNYLSSQPERVSFVVKISGTVLTSVLAVFGTIPWLITSAYIDHYTPPVTALDHRTLHFTPDGVGGYLVDEIPFRWDDSFGERVAFPALNPVVGYDFDFPFFGQPYHQIFIDSDGGIGLGEAFIPYDAQYYFTSTPIIYPLLAFYRYWVPQENQLPPEWGVFFHQEANKAIITWYKLEPVFPSASQKGTYTFQTVLYENGSFDITYNGLPDLKFYADSRPDATAWAVGIKPATSPPGTANFTNLPMQIGPDGALQDENLSFRIYLHNFLAPLAIAILASSLFFLIGAILVLNYGLARPLNLLLKGVQNFNQGQRDISIPIQSNDEIGFLTESFNQVGGELHDLINRLEERVTERTEALAIANSQLRLEMDAHEADQKQIVAQQRAVAALEERERMARDLHDGIGQVLGFLNVQAQSANDSVRAGDRDSATQLLSRMTEVAQEAHDDVRGYILGLKETSPGQSDQNFIALLERYCQHLSQNFGFQVRLHLPTNLPPMLVARTLENQLLYMIREALSNARAHSGEKDADVMLTFDDARIQVVVEDQGKGFVNNKKNGHFGLEIMRERAKEIGGSLTVNSTPGVGTCVTIDLPRQPERDATPGRRILLVDDHPLFLEGMANLLTGRGMSVVGTAKDGLDAQQKARELLPDVILMDIEMPRCDGLEATRRIKIEMPAVKIVMLTVFGEERHLFDALQSGASGYLLKSLDAVELTSLLDELLRGEVSLSPSLANKMLEAFTRHKTLFTQPLGLHLKKVPAPAELTERQMEILKLVAQGETYKGIALQLGLAEVTVKYHMGEILARLHLDSRREAGQYLKDGKLKVQ